MTELTIPNANNASSEELAIALSPKTLRCLSDTLAVEINNEEPISKKARLFFEFDKNEEKLLKSVLTSSPKNCTILESKVSKNTASLFLVEIILDKDLACVMRNKSLKNSEPLTIHSSF
jgi:hypothetical protein